jgi:hypothetical protein
MKKIILDSGPIITLALNNNLLWLLQTTKTKYGLNFYITKGVKKEIVDNPLTTKKFKFEALQVLNLIEKKVIEVLDEDKIKADTERLLELANSCYKTRDRYLRLVHYAEISALAAAKIFNANAIMIDERTTRYLLERPHKLKNILSHKLHTKVDINKKQLSILRKETKGIKLIRSAEFVAIAFEKGLLDEFLPKVHEPKKTLLEALLWGAKLNGCAISTRDLETLQRESLKIRK